MNKLDAALNFHQTALRIRNQRQEILASNIANADTPQYKARDIDFASSLQTALQHTQAKPKALSQQEAGLPAQLAQRSSPFDGLQTSQQNHMDGAGTSNFAANGEPLFRPVIQGSVDGNSVDMDVERNAFVDNAIRYEASLTMISGQIKKMLTAINGQ